VAVHSRAAAVVLRKATGTESRKTSVKPRATGLPKGSVAGRCSSWTNPCQERQVEGHDAGVVAAQRLEQAVVDDPEAAHERERQQVRDEARDEIDERLVQLVSRYFRHLEIQDKQRDGTAITPSVKAMMRPRSLRSTRCS
jgi:hypothetical protein